eukprot:1300459-Pyramimonas_sp.AAC.1
MWALMWVLSQDATTPVEVAPDALNVINPACGAAQCHVHPELGSAIRALSCLLAQRGHIAWYHINSHIGHPWNELADGVAELAGHRHLMKPNYQAVEAIATHRYLSWECIREAPTHHRSVPTASWRVLRHRNHAA